MTSLFLLSLPPLSIFKYKLIGFKPRDLDAIVHCALFYCPVSINCSIVKRKRYLYSRTGIEPRPIVSEPDIFAPDYKDTLLFHRN